MRRGGAAGLQTALAVLCTLLLTTCASGAGATQPTVRLHGPEEATPTMLPAPTATEVTAVAAAPSPLVSLFPPYAPPPPGARLLIPQLGIDGSVVPVGVTGEGEVEAPTSGTAIGWYNLSPAPGAWGNSILVGHVDYQGSTAVFWRLRELKPDDIIEYVDGNGGRARYRVEWAQSFPANAAPLDVVFASTRDGRLTLITCEGNFDPVTRNYQHRLVVRAIYIGS